jgi:hypothetical protein
MPLQGEAKRLRNNEDYAQKKAEREKAQAAAAVYIDQDTAGVRYKSEVLSYADLLNIYGGVKSRPSPENTDNRKKVKKTRVRPQGMKIFDLDHTFELWLELRDKARKDLFWLGKDVLLKDLVATTHQVVCDQFVQKQFDGAWLKGYTIGDVHRVIGRQERFDELGRPTREMLLLDPRGFFKSTIDGIDCVQWLLNCPDIRILILTGEYKLAVAFMREIKEYFYLPLGGEPKTLHLLFPEYILTGRDGTSKEPIKCPARRLSLKEASLWVNSIDANLSGWHCDLRKGDDVITDTNCNNETTRATLKEKFDGTNNLVDEWGFRDNIGTRYWLDDWYGKRLERHDQEDFVPLKYLCRKAWYPKPGFEEVPIKKLTKDMVTLTFPEKATFSSLREKLLTNERSFRNQQLNEPSDPGEDSGYRVAFNEDILRLHLYQPTMAPKDGDIFICWDWAPSSERKSDYSAGVAARVVIKDGVASLVILEIIFDKWRPSELAFQIVMFNKKWNPKQTLIERSTGSDLLQLELQRQAFKYSTTLEVYWKPVSTQPDAKRNRIKSLETLLNDNRLWFVMGSWIDTTFEQLTRYTGERKNRGRKDDIPDAMSFLCFFIPQQVANEDLEAMREAQGKIAAQRQQYDRIFGGVPIPQSEPPLLIPQVPIDPRGKFRIPGLRLN